MILSALLFRVAVSLLIVTNSESSSSVSSFQQHQQDDDVPKIIIGKDIHGIPVRMPLVGAGTGGYNETIAYQSVCKAFAAGYTFVDTAFGYGNQRGVGKAIQDCWERPRQDLFVMTKIPGGLDKHQVVAAHIQNLLQLNLDYVDHLMVHYTADWDGTTNASPQARQEEWLALEDIYRRGEARSIGISHYCPRHIDDVLKVASVTPSVNQVEYHVGSQDVDHVISKCRENNITFMSFSPLCGPCKYDSKDSLVSGDLVTEIGKEYGVSGSQVSLRYIVQQALSMDGWNDVNTNSGTINSNGMGGVIPKSNNEDHIRLNGDIFSFSLSQEHMERLKAVTKPEPEAGDCDVP